MSSTTDTAPKTENALRILKHRETLKAQGKGQLNLMLPIELHEPLRLFAKSLKSGVPQDVAARILFLKISEFSSQSLIEPNIPVCEETKPPIKYHPVKYSINFKQRSCIKQFFAMGGGTEERILLAMGDNNISRTSLSLKENLFMQQSHFKPIEKLAKTEKTLNIKNIFLFIKSKLRLQTLVGLTSKFQVFKKMSPSTEKTSKNQLSMSKSCLFGFHSVSVVTAEQRRAG